MKKILIIFSAFMIVSTMIVSDLFAITGYNFSNSTEYIRTQSRNATTMTADAVYYNPVGLVKLQDGMYFHLGNQMGAKKYSHKYRPYNKTYADTTFVPTIPFLAFVYKNGKGAGFLSVDVPAGGGTLEYEDKVIGLPAITAGFSTQLAAAGFPTAQITKLYVKNFWIRGQVGGSFALTDMVALTGGVRFFQLMEERKAKMGGSALNYIQYDLYDVEKTANGSTGFVGVMLSPMNNLNITLLYQGRVIARGTQKDNHGISRSAAFQDELPAYIALGIGFKATEAMEIQLSFDYVFSGTKKLGSRYTATALSTAVENYVSSLGTYSLVYGMKADIAFNTAGGNYMDNNYFDQTRVGLGIEYKIGMVKPSIGLAYETPINSSKISTNIVKPELYKVVIGGGVQIMPTDSITVDLAYSKHIYKEQGFAGIMGYDPVKLNKDINSFGFSVGYKM